MKVVKSQVLKPGEDPLLAGRVSGKRAFARLFEGLPPIDEPMIVVVDFRDATIATASYLQEAVVPLRDYLSLKRPPAYVVVANMNPEITEEFDQLLRRSADALLACSASPSGQLFNMQLLGTLDAKLLDTFHLITRKGETSAIELHNDSDELPRVGPTAWNNRLAALASKSLIVEVSRGRTKKYRPLLEIA